MSKYTMSITGSNVGALAIGPDAEAKSASGPAATGERFDVYLDIKGATPEYAIEVLRMLIAKVRQHDGKNVSLASATPQGKVAYTVVRHP